MRRRLALVVSVCVVHTYLAEDAAGFLVFVSDEGVLSVVHTPRRMLCPVLTPGCIYVRIASDGGPSFLVPQSG